MITVKKINYPGVNGLEKRRLYIYTPLDYEYMPDTRYPVLYMLDGHNVFYDKDATYGKSWGVGRYLDQTQTPLIVVALECNHGDHNERLSEYSPYSFNDQRLGPITGCGEQTMEWFVHTLKPQIDRRYRTLPDRDHTFIGGSSMGGLMALYAVLQYNEFFSKAAALSPAIWMSYNKMCQLAHFAPVAFNTTVYMDYGSEEMNYRERMECGFSDYGKYLLERGIAVTSRIVPDGGHCEASWERQLPFVFATLMYDIVRNNTDISEMK